MLFTDFISLFALCPRSVSTELQPFLCHPLKARSRHGGPGKHVDLRQAARSPTGDKDSRGEARPVALYSIETPNVEGGSPETLANLSLFDFGGGEEALREPA
ncbi:hypothetical protein VTI28DRAFT_232 [Corynascus sepedonium]